MTFDDLYGAGAFATFQAAQTLLGLTATPTTVQSDNGGGWIHVEVNWADPSAAGAQVAICKMDFGPTRVHYSQLECAPGYRQRGVYASLIRHHVPLYRPWGITMLSGSAVPGSRSEWQMKIGGLERQPDGTLSTQLTGGHMEAYRQWVAAGSNPATEPAWHATLKNNPVAGNDPF